MGGEVGLFPIIGAVDDEAGRSGDTFGKLALAELRFTDREGMLLLKTVG